ncbi:O-antigen ligase family protein [bacterium]|nr:O-antigen ligase family protein [bacterium]
MFIDSYRSLWADGQQTQRPAYFLTWLLLLACIAIPITFGLTSYAPDISISLIKTIVVIACLILFFDISKFSIFVLPLILFARYHHPFIMLGIFLFLSFITWQVFRGELSFKMPYPLLLTVIVLTGINGLMKSVDFEAGRFYFEFTLVLPLLVFIIFYNLNFKTNDIRKQLLVLAIVASIIGLLSFARYLSTHQVRVIMFWGKTQQNAGAALLSMFVPFVLVSMIDSRGRLKMWFYLSLLLGLIGGVLVSQTRGVLFSIILTVIYIAWRDRRVLKIMIPVFIVGFVALPTLVLYRMLMLFGVGAEVDWSSVGRIQIWWNSMRMMPDYFLFGMGFDSFRQIYITRFPIAFIEAVHPHNIILRWIFEYGVFGMIAIVLVISKIWLKAHRTVVVSTNDKWSDNSRLLLTINASVLSIVFAGMFDCFLTDIRIVLVTWLFMAYQLVLSNRIANEGGRG